MSERLVISNSGGQARTINDGRKIEHLNADLLDGKHLSDLALAGHTHPVEPTTTPTATYITATSAYEVPGGAVNCINTVFTTTWRFVPLTLKVWYNGVLQRITEDYTENAGEQSFTMVTVPSDIGMVDRIMVEYIKL